MAVVTKIIQVEGMSCSHCEKAVNDALTAVTGVEKAEVSLENKSVTVQYDADKVTEDTLKEAIKDAGYDIA